MSAKSLVVGVHPANEEILKIEEHPNGTVAVLLVFRNRADAEAFIRAVEEQNTPSDVHWNRVHEQVQAAGLSDDLRGE